MTPLEGQVSPPFQMYAFCALERCKSVVFCSWNGPTLLWIDLGLRAAEPRQLPMVSIEPKY
jgi:hypothetical protein